LNKGANTGYVASGFFTARLAPCFFFQAMHRATNPKF
jgi:hypothetical protein